MTDWLSVDPRARSETGGPRYDPATKYAISVVQREIVAPDKVVKVYERHLDDLDRSKQPGSGIRWDYRELARFYRFCRQYCVIPDRLQAENKLLELLPAYMGMYGLFLGWKIDNPAADPKIDPQERKHGSARYRTLFLETPKSPLALDTPVLTTRGWSRMGELRIGDRIFTPEGLPTKIVAVSPVFFGLDCYELEFDDGERIVASGDHRWEVQRAAGLEEQTITKLLGAGDRISESRHETDSRREPHVVQAIRQVPSVPTRCITVADEGHMFLAGRNLVPTGNSGKTPVAAAFILYHLVGMLPPPAREGVKPEDPPVVFVGTDLMDQNLVIRGFLDRMIEGDFFGPEGANVEYARGEYYCVTTQGVVLFRSAKGRGRGTSGFAPSLLVFDECQDWESLTLRDNLLMGLGKRIEARTIYLLNAGIRDQRPIWTERAKAARIAEGISPDDSYLPMIWGVDARDDPLESEDSWPKAYPTLGITVHRSAVLERVRAAKKGSAHDRSNVLRLNFGVWQRAVSEDWLDFSVIESCFRPQRPERDDWETLPCVVGLDLSRSSDLTGFSLGFWIPGGHVWMESDGYTCDRGLGKIVSRAEDLPIRAWIEDPAGGIQLANTLRGESIDYDVIARRLVETAERYNVQAVGIDSYGKERFYDALHKLTPNYVRDTEHSQARPIRPGGLVFIEHPNTKFRKPVHFAGRQKDVLYIHDTIERMGQRMSAGTVTFLDSPALAWNFGCVQVTRQGESMVMMKSNAMEVMAGRIDIVAASFYALGVLEKVVGTEARRAESHQSQMAGMARLAALMRGEDADELEHDT